jgi:site-specific DNA-cytosine methylase
MNILIACEFSGIVREAFKARGHNAWSCDLSPTEIPGQHIQDDVLYYLDDDCWDMMIAHPPCTDIAVCGAKHFIYKQEQQKQAIAFFMQLVNANIPKIAIENPVGIMSTKYRKPDQYIQPWQYGHGETKKTCLWLKNLPLLKPTNIVDGREQRIWKMSPSPERGKLRSIFYSGIAAAMAEQWS